MKHDLAVVERGYWAVDVELELRRVKPDAVVDEIEAQQLLDGDWNEVRLGGPEADFDWVEVVLLVPVE